MLSHFIIIMQPRAKCHVGVTTSAAKINSKITGKNKVKTTDSRWRLNCLTSRKLRSTPIRIVSFKVFILIHQSFEDISPQDLGVVPEALESDY